MREGLSIEQWDGEMEKGVNFTMHIVYRELPSLRSHHPLGGGTLSLDLGD